MRHASRNMRIDRLGGLASGGSSAAASTLNQAGY